MSTTLPHDNKSSTIWSTVRKDRDVDDLIFGTGQDGRWEPDVSER